jgi:hypothetical protein
VEAIVGLNLLKVAVDTVADLSPLRVAGIDALKLVLKVDTDDRLRRHL